MNKLDTYDTFKLVGSLEQCNIVLPWGTKPYAPFDLCLLRDLCSKLLGLYLLDDIFCKYCGRSSYRENKIKLITHA